MIAMALMFAGVAETPNLAWLEGEWCTPLENDRQTCEIWGPTRGGTMLGSSHTVQGERTRSFEFMRIVLTGDGATFFAHPQGAAGVPFQQTGREEAGVTFANPANDYPQRIRYWRRGAELVAEITLADGSKPMRWVYTRVR